MSTKIEWTNETWNPIRATYYEPDRVYGYTKKEGVPRIGWHCERVSDGCVNCYAERQNVVRRFDVGTGLPYNRKSRDLVDVYLDEDVLTKPLHWKKPRRIFVCSMTDLFGEWVPDEFIDRMFAVMALTPQHTYQVLTKRPATMRHYMERKGRIYAREGENFEVYMAPNVDCWGCADANEATDPERSRAACYCNNEWHDLPLPNVHLGTSVENQREADRRVPEILRTPAAVRFLSCEPLLGPMDLWDIQKGELRGISALTGERWRRNADGDPEFAGDIKRPLARGENMPFGEYLDLPSIRIDWVIVGGESGPGARPCDIEWIRSIVRQCQAADVPVFVKQDSGSKPGKQGRIPDDLWLKEFPRG